MLPEGGRFVVVDVGAGRSSPNHAVIGDGPADPRAILGLPIILRPRVANYSTAKVNDLPVSVFVEEREIARMRVSLDPGQVAQREVVYVPERDGVLKGRFEASLDRFPEDDAFLFTLTVVPQLKIILVRPNPADPADPSQDEALYLRAALEAASHSPLTTHHSPLSAMAPRDDLMRSLDVKEIAEPELTAEQIQDASLVILANCGALNADQFAMLRDFVFKGGGLLVFPGDHVNGPALSGQFFIVPGQHGTPPRAPGALLTPATLGEAKGDPENADTFERFANIDFKHPVMRVFEEPDAQFLRTVQFFRFLPMQLAEGGHAAWSLAHFTNGSPALLESRFGEGRMILAAFPANTRWTNLPMKPEFVPLVLRLAGHLAHKPDLEGPSVVTAGRPAQITLDPSWTPATGTVEDGVGRETPLEFQWSGTRLLAVFEETKRKGYYTAEVMGAPDGDKPRNARLSFAINLSPEESDFRTVGENQLREWLHSEDLTVVDASAQIQHLKGSVGDEREIWRPLIYLTFVIIGCEFLLSTSSGHRRTAEERLSLAERARRMNPATWIRNMTGGAEFTE